MIVAMTPLWRPLAAALGAGGAVAAWATFVEPHAFTLRRVEVPVLPAGSRPLRVLHLSDLHLTPRQRHKIRWVRALADLEPDLVVTTGDNLAHEEAVPALLEAYEGLLALPGAFVLGSNDYFPPTPKNPLRYFNDSHRRGPDLTPRRLPTGDMVAAFRAAGWLDLGNAAGVLEVGGLSLDLRGVDDPHLGFDDYAAVAGPAEPGADLAVGLTHAPYQRVLDAMTSDGTRLVLAGHTHGGQVCVPFWGRALVTNCDLDTGRARGLSRWWPGAGSASGRHTPDDAAYLHVSAGLGGSPYTPFRLACRPEATLLTLR
jgi:uncharacterized protein